LPPTQAVLLPFVHQEHLPLTPCPVEVARQVVWSVGTEQGPGVWARAARARARTRSRVWPEGGRKMDATA
jgi:hypothetical protein